NGFGFNNFNNWNYYGNSNYWGGMYSFYQPGFIGSYGNFYGGNGFYGNGFYGDVNSRNLTPRPRGSYDNERSSGRTIPIPPLRQPRPDAAYPNNGGRAVDSRGNGTYTPNSRPTRGGSSDSRDTRPTQQQPTSRPTRPTSTPTRSSDNSRSSEPSSRPSRVERPSSPPPSSSNDNSRSSSGSSNGNSSPRPTRGGN
ncbi:MAG: hypothetical protein H7098_12350, partial [Oligoflexus sp.]|nr:hypothetical protein [Pseudopedobacter sp.]